MFSDINELKQFILWAKQQKVQELHVDKVVVVFSALALTDDLFEPLTSSEPRKQHEEKDTSSLLLDEPGENAESDEDLLFYSSKG